MNLKKQKKQEEQDTVTVALTKELKTKMNVKVVEQHEVDSYENCTQTQSSSWSQMRIQKTHHNAQLSKKENKVVKLKLLPKSNQELLIQRSRHQDRQLAEYHQRTR